MSLLALCARLGDGCALDRFRSWQSLTTIHRGWVVAAFAVCALFGGGVALTTAYGVDRLWGILAACGYALAALVALTWKSRGVDVALAVSFCAALVIPLAWVASAGQGQPDVGVVERSAELLVRHGSPYEVSVALDGTHNPNAYNPYLPAMSLFGVPWAVFGHSPVVDPRVWFGLTFFVAFGLALAVAGAKDIVRWTVFVAGSPIIAIELVTGGTDVPVLALLCLGFALLWRRPRPLLAAAAFGAAAAMKATAWPALAVVVVLLAARDGRRTVTRFTGLAVGVVALLDGLFAVARPDTLTKNTILFPLGLASVKSQAASPLPGHLLEATGQVGHWAAIALLVLAAAGVAFWLVVRIPRTVPDAVLRLVVGLTLMFGLAPATRFGYFIYPAAILLWLGASAVGQSVADHDAAESAPPYETDAVFAGD